MKPAVLLFVPIYPNTQAELETHYSVLRYFEHTDKEALFKQLQTCEILVTHGGRGVQASIMERLPKLKLVACFGVGVDAIDLDYCKVHGIAVTNTPDVLTEDVADMALALLLGCIRQIPQGDQYIRAGYWLKGAMPVTRSLQQAHVGIVGMGRIGQAIAKRCAAFNTHIGYHGPRKKADISYPYFDNVVTMAKWANVIIAACPGGKDTEKVISREALKALGPTGVLVNIARGSVVDQEALIEFLQSGELGGAGLDVFNNEPKVPQTLIDLGNVVMQPHQGSGTTQTRTAMGQLVLDNIAAFVGSQPLITPV
jgi:lactate dehydrogenase-like 2-hydroxyacid dehydrogenase